MKITFEKPKLTNCWIVEAHGYSGDADADNLKEVYVGADEAVAKRTYLEVEALSRAYPNGRGGDSQYSYTRLVSSLFAEREAARDFNRDGPFGWAANVWSYDLISGESDATLKGADLIWVNEHGAKIKATVELSFEEQSLLDSVPIASPKTSYPIESIMANFLALDLRDEIVDPKRSKPHAPL